MKISVAQAAANIVAYRNEIGEPIPVPDIIFGKIPRHKNLFSDEWKKKNVNRNSTRK